MGYQIGDRKLPLDVAWTDADGIQRPANWLRLSTERDRELLGITWVADTSASYDQPETSFDRSRPSGSNVGIGDHDSVAVVIHNTVAIIVGLLDLC